MNIDQHDGVQRKSPNALACVASRHLHSVFRLPPAVWLQVLSLPLYNSDSKSRGLQCTSVSGRAGRGRYVTWSRSVEIEKEQARQSGMNDI